MYRLFKDQLTNWEAVIRLSDGACIPKSEMNTDYQAFKKALQTGKNADGTAVSLEDINGTVMSTDQITTFLATLP